MTVSHDGNRITIDGRTIALEVPIDEIFELPDRVIVLFDEEEYPESDSRENRNVVALDRDGRELWRIEQARTRLRDSDGNRIPNPYVGVSAGADGRTVEVYTWAGVCYRLDPNTGKISDPILTK